MNKIERWGAAEALVVGQSVHVAKAGRQEVLQKLAHLTHRNWLPSPPDQHLNLELATAGQHNA